MKVQIPRKNNKSGFAHWWTVIVGGVGVVTTAVVGWFYSDGQDCTEVSADCLTQAAAIFGQPIPPNAQTDCWNVYICCLDKQNGTSVGGTRCTEDGFTG